MQISNLTFAKLITKSQISNFRGNQKGFTFFELIITLGITLTLFGIITINLFRTQRKTSLDATIQTFVSDFKSQQIKTMVGATEGRANSDNYGVYFSLDKYTLFHGLVYNPTDPANFVIQLDQNINFNPIGFQNNTIVFLQQSGEVSTYSATANTVTIKNIAGTEQKTITVNRYGVITNIQ